MPRPAEAADEADVRARLPVRARPARGPGADRRQGGEPRPDARAGPAAAGATRLRDHHRRPAARSWPPAGPTGLDAELRERMAEVEAATGRRFGDPADPLLVSVRSGAPVSMPGMMDTILNLGLTAATTEGLAAATGDPAFAAACRDRLATMFRVDRRRRARARRPVGAAAARDRGGVPLLEQRPRHRLPHGARASPTTSAPAVTVQAMVFGNRGADSGDRGRVHAQPGDRRARAVRRRPVRRPGRGRRRRHASDGAHRRPRRAPARGRRARCARPATRLEHHLRDLCDIEFTIEQGRLWLLQVRVGKRSPQAALRIAVDMAKDPSFPLSRAEAVERVAPLLVGSADA